MKVNPKTIAPEIITFLFIFLFVYTGLNKLIGHNSFEQTLSSMPVLRAVASITAWLIPSVELFTAALLLFDKTRRAGMLLSVILMTGFTIYIGGMLTFASKLPCSCGGVLSKMNWTTHFWFNLIFLVLGITGYFNSQKTYRFIAINRISRKPV